MSKYFNPYTRTHQEINSTLYSATLLKDIVVRYPPFDMSIINGRMPNGKHVEYLFSDNVKEGTVDFILWLTGLFHEYHTGKFGERLQIQEYTVDSCTKLLLNYINQIEKDGDVKVRDSLFYHTRIWLEETKSVVWRIFIQNCLTINVLGKQQGTFSLFEAIILALDNTYFDCLNRCNLPEAKALLGIIPFNVWEANYHFDVAQMDRSVPLTSEELAKVDVRKNIEYFYSIVSDHVLNATAAGKTRDYKDMVVDLDRLFQRLFSDYIKRLKVSKIVGTQTVHHAIAVWKDTATGILYRCFFVQSGFYAMEIKKGHIKVVNTKCLDGDDLDAHDKRSEMCETIITHIQRLCDDFDKTVSRTWPKYNWSQALNELDIQYEKLLSRMNKELLSPIIPLDVQQFILCFEEAEFSELLKSVLARSGKRRDGHLGCVYYLISEVGEVLGKEWFEKAAESVCDKKGSEARKAMRTHTGTDAMEVFSQVLHDCIPKLPYRDKNNRQ